MLIAENISKEINGNKILNNVSLTLLASQITAVIGANGSGKSSLLRALALIDPPSEGKITIEKTCYNFPTKSIANTPWPKLGVVFQQHFLWPHLTIRENISLPAKANKISNFDTEFERVISAMNLKEFLDRYPNQVSGGQRQRAALARALILKPSYLLMDEITASLDIEQTREVINYLPKLKAEGTSILIITHLFGLARQIADNVIFLDHGQIIEQGSTAAVLDNPTSPRLSAFLTFA